MALKRHKSSFDEISTQLVTIEEAPTKQSQDEKCSGSTEEFREDVNVLWDYNSPQSKPKPKGRISGKKKLKIENYNMSPRAPLRRHLSENDKQIIKQDFCKLREDMRALKDAIAKPDHETSLVISPREERFFKIDLEEDPPDDFEHNMMDFDPFDDNMDNQLLTFSQQFVDIPDGTKVKARLEDTEVFNDSFDNLDSDMLDQLTQVMDIEQPKNVGDNKQTITNFSSVTPHSSPGKSRQNCVQSELSQEKLQEIIEKKRLEALAKLEAKKNRLNPNKTASTVIVSMQENKQVPNFNCDRKSELSEEKLQEIIEKKRLEALAKLEANKKRLDPDKTIEIATLSPEKHNFHSISKDEIEKKRLEAMAKLKRLEPNKPKLTDVLHCTPEEKTTNPVQTFNIDNNSEISKAKLHEIEKKKLEAMAKLEANKRRPEPNKVPETTSSSSSNSPLHCTPEEIEKKRLEALAKREAKRQQDIIEKRKLEALKRREESQKKMRPNQSSLNTKIF